MIEWLQRDNMKEWVIHIGFVSVRRGGKSGSRDTCVKNAKDLVHLRKSKKVQALEVKVQLQLCPCMPSLPI